MTAPHESGPPPTVTLHDGNVWAYDRAQSPFPWRRIAPLDNRVDRIPYPDNPHHQLTAADLRTIADVLDPPAAPSSRPEPPATPTEPIGMNAEDWRTVFTVAKNYIVERQAYSVAGLRWATETISVIAARNHERWLTNVPSEALVRSAVRADDLANDIALVRTMKAEVHGDDAPHVAPNYENCMAALRVVEWAATIMGENR